MIPANFQRDAPLGPRTTLGVGGPARYGLATDRLATLRQALAWGQATGTATLVLGGGSNVLVADRGFDGLVLQYTNRRMAWSAAGAPVGCRRLVAGGGTPWEDLVKTAVAAHCAGIECLAGIPGLVGAAPVQNIGAYGQEIANAIVAVHAVERRTGHLTSLTRDACDFGYRTSRFKTLWRDRYVIVRVDLQLVEHAPGHTGYGELHTFFAHTTTPPSVQDVQTAVLRLRQRKSMVLMDPSDPNRRSAGSFFMNPVVPVALSDALQGTYGPAMPLYPADDGTRKLSAAWLIEQSGFTRGYVRGAVGLSRRHALAIINRGGASAMDIVTFAATIRRAVMQRFGIALTPEVQLVGFEPNAISALVDPL